MKVLHVYRTYFPDPPGGLQEAIRQIAISTQKFDVESRIFALSPNPHPHEINRPEGLVIRARSWASPASCDLGLSTAFSRFSAQAEWADVIHYHFPWPFADVLNYFVKPGKPSVVTYQSDVVGKGWLGRLYRPLTRFMLNRMNAVIATSPAYAESSFILKNQVKAERLHTIPLGITESSYEKFRQDAADVVLQERFGLEPNSFILFVGVLRPYKGLKTLVEAVAQTDITLAIAGTGREQAYLNSLAATLPNIHLLGQVSNAEKMALIRGCRALVLPSHLRSEAFGMVLVEAAMCARPMISCEIGTGTSFINLHQETGLVVPPADPVALAEAMNALQCNDEMANQMGQAARVRYEQLFSGPALGKAYSSLYRKVANG